LETKIVPFATPVDALFNIVIDLFVDLFFPLLKYDVHELLFVEESKNSSSIVSSVFGNESVRRFRDIANEN